MPEYLTKEEVRQWRSSLERITLEEFAARLGKVVQGEKQTNDMIDKVMTHSLNEMSSGFEVPRERLQTLVLGKNITEHKEHTVVVKPNREKSTKTKDFEKPVEKVVEKTKQVQEVVKNTSTQDETKAEKTKTVQSETTEYTFKKPLIPREQMIFDYLLEHKGDVVYAKDMAALLNLKRDYVYKYIKNLRQKLNEEVLTNANNGGYILS